MDSVQQEWSRQFDELEHMFTHDKERGEHAIKTWMERNAVLKFIAPYMVEKPIKKWWEFWK